MKFCSKCGNELFDEAVICPKCGCATGDVKQAKAQAPNQNQHNKNQALGAALILGGIAVMVTFVILVLSQL